MECDYTLKNQEGKFFLCEPGNLKFIEDPNLSSSFYKDDIEAILKSFHDIKLYKDCTIINRDEVIEEYNSKERHK